MIPEEGEGVDLGTLLLLIDTTYFLLFFSWSMVDFWAICMQVKKQPLELYMEGQTGSKLGKGYVKVVYCHPAYLMSIQSLVQFSHSVVSDSLRPREPQHAKPPLSITNSWSSPKLMCIKSVMPSSHRIPLSSPSPPAPNPSQHQGLFQWVNSSHEVAKVLEFQPQLQSFQWTPRTVLL